VDTTSDMLIIRTIFDISNSRKLKKIPPRQYWKYTDRADSDAYGEPTRWTHVGGGSNRGYLYLHPTPDDNYNLDIFYRALPDDLSGTETTVIGAEWDEIIVKAAVWLARLRLNEYDKAKEDKIIVRDMIRDLVGLYDQENLDINDQVIPHPAMVLSNE